MSTYPATETIAADAAAVASSEEARRFIVPIIASGTWDDDGREPWVIDLEVRHAAILTVSAYGAAGYVTPDLTTNPPGTGGNAGVEVQIAVDRQTMAVDQSFEAQTHQGTFHASATHVQILRAGTHRIQVSHRKLGGADRDCVLRASFHAVPAFDLS
ncbi:MAG: hypothetical protein AAF772_07160 [Acidobacteriota bacterium]